MIRYGARGAVVMDVLDRIHQRLLVGAETQCRVRQPATVGKAQQLQHAQRVQPLAAARIHPRQRFGRGGKRGRDRAGVTQRPAAAQAQDARISLPVDAGVRRGAVGYRFHAGQAYAMPRRRVHAAWPMPCLCAVRARMP